MLPRPATARRSTPCSGRWGRLGDAGQATLEHTALAVLVGAVVLALAVVPAGPRLADALRLVVCQITGGHCAAGASRVPRCVLSTRGESVASSGHLLVALGERHGSEVEMLGGGGANLITDNGFQVGAQAAAGVELGTSEVTTTKTGPPGRGGAERATAVPEKGGAGQDGPARGPDRGRPGADADGGPERAEAEAAEAGPRLGELQAVLGLEGTASVSAVRSFSDHDDLLGYQDGGAGAGQRAVDVLDSTLQRTGLKAGDAHPPDAYRVEVAAAFSGDAGADLLGAAGAQAGFSGGRAGTLEWNPDSDGFTYTGTVEGSAMAGASLARWGGAGEGVASAEVTIAFDGDMDPTDLTFLSDTESTRDGEGSATTRTSTLHLQDSDRTAVLAAMPALVGAQDPVSIAGSAAPLAYLGQRMERDGVEAKAVWRVSGGETDTGWSGALLAKVGVSRVRTTDETTVESMEYRDHAQGDTSWKKVPPCP